MGSELLHQREVSAARMEKAELDRRKMGRREAALKEAHAALSSVEKKMRLDLDSRAFFETLMTKELPTVKTCPLTACRARRPGHAVNMLTEERLCAMQATPWRSIHSAPRLCAVCAAHCRLLCQ